MSDPRYRHQDVVWCKFGGLFWPGEVQSLESLPEEIRDGFLRTPLVVVKFFGENSYEFVLNDKNVFPYNCEKKEEFIKRGMARSRSKAKEGATSGWFAKFPRDVVHCEQVTGGDTEILEKEPYVEKEKVDISHIFGQEVKKAKGKRKDSLGGKQRGAKRKLESPAGAGGAKKTKRRDTGGLTPNNRVRTLVSKDYKARILIQSSTPFDIQFQKKESASAFSPYKCPLCDFTTCRLNVIVMHDKSHSEPCKLPGKKGRGVVDWASRVGLIGGTPDKPKKLHSTPGPSKKLSLTPASAKQKKKTKSTSSGPAKYVEPKKPQEADRTEEGEKAPAAGSADKTPASVKKPVAKKPRMSKKKKEEFLKRKEEEKKKILIDWSEDENEEEEEKRKFNESRADSDGYNSDAGLDDAPLLHMDDSDKDDDSLHDVGESVFGRNTSNYFRETKEVESGLDVNSPDKATDVTGKKMPAVSPAKTPAKPETAQEVVESLLNSKLLPDKTYSSPKSRSTEQSASGVRSPELNLSTNQSPTAAHSKAEKSATSKTTNGPPETDSLASLPQVEDEIDFGEKSGDKLSPGSPQSVKKSPKKPTIIRMSDRHSIQLPTRPDQNAQLIRHAGSRPRFGALSAKGMARLKAGASSEHQQQAADHSRPAPAAATALTAPAAPIEASSPPVGHLPVTQPLNNSCAQPPAEAPAPAQPPALQDDFDNSPVDGMLVSFGTAKSDGAFGGPMDVPFTASVSTPDVAAGGGGSVATANGIQLSALNAGDGGLRLTQSVQLVDQQLVDTDGDTIFLLVDDGTDTGSLDSQTLFIDPSQLQDGVLQFQDSGDGHVILHSTDQHK